MANQIPGWIFPLAAGFILGGIVFTKSGRKLASSAAGAGARKTSSALNRLSGSLEGV